jgi:PTS system nitrogen regulatory IIA component
MQISDFLAPSCVTVGVRASDKMRLLRDLAQRAATALGLPAEDVTAALLRRETLGSTGTGGGIAIPHARLAGVKKPFGMLVLLDKAIDFAAIDERKVDVVFLLLLPADAQGDPLNALAAAARTLRDPQTVQKVRAAPDDGALYSAVTAAARRPG